MKKEFGRKERIILVQGSLVFLILYIFICMNAIDKHYMPILFAPLVLVITSIIFYFMMGRYSSIDIVKDKVLSSIASALLIGPLIIVGWSYTHPKIEDLRADAIKADEQYFFLLVTSLDHKKVCKAGAKAFKLHERVGNIDRAKLIAHGLIQDKCF